MQTLVENLRGVVGLVDLLHHSGQLATDPRLNHRYVDAVALLNDLPFDIQEGR